MTDQLREEARWRKEKTPIIFKYIEDHNRLFDEIAGRGFLALPGYAYDMENSLELMTKFNISEINYKILTETIEREMKQLGIDYNLAYRNAVMVWEIGKQVLLADWATEYAVIQQGLMNDENVLNTLANEVKKRELTLISSKLVIELAMEVDRKAIVALDGQTATYEVQLANAKILTAQKKLDLIPILLEIVEKEQQLLVIAQSKAAAYTDYMTAEQVLVAKKQTLIPFINDLAAMSESYSQSILTVELPILQQLSAEKIAQSLIAIQKALYQVQELTIEVDTEEKSITLMDAKRALEVLQFTDDEMLISTDNTLMYTYHLDQISDFEALLAEDQAADGSVLSNKLSVLAIQLATHLESITTITSGERSRDYKITQAEINKINQVAGYEAAAKITASLNHLIG